MPITPVIIRPTAILIVGQSYGANGYGNGLAHYCVQERVRLAFEANPSAVSARLAGNPAIITGAAVPQRRNVCVSGSSVLAKHDAGSGYWVGNDGITAGPLLTTAVNAIGTYPAIQKPTMIIYNHWEANVGFTLVPADVALVRAAVENTLFPQLRTACFAASPTSIPIFCDILGPRFAGNEAAEYAYRDAMLDMIAAGTNVFRGAEKYALVLDLTIHPVSGLTGYSQMGAHTGRKIESWLLTGQTLAGPTIASAVRTVNSVAVTITVPIGKTLITPAQPDFFGLFDGAGAAIPVTNWSWSGNVLTLSAASPAASLRYPVPLRVGSGPTKPADINKIVRLTAPSDPLFPGEPGLVLESAKAFTL